MRMGPKNAQISQKYEHASEGTEKIDVANVIPWAHCSGVDISAIVKNDIYQLLEQPMAVNDFKASARSTPDRSSNARMRSASGVATTVLRG